MPEAAEAAAPAAPAEAPAAPSVPAAGTDAPAAAPEPTIIGTQATDKTPSLAPPSFVNPDGTFVPDWTQKLPDDFSDARVSLSRYKSVAELAKAYRHAERLTGQRGIVPPTAESSPEQVAEFRKVMGVPEKPEAYAESIKPKVEVPEGVQWDDGIAQQYFQVAHKHNIPASAMQELVQLNLKQRQFEAKAQNDMVQEKRQEGIQSLRQQWGANYEKNLHLARKGAQYFGVDENDPGFNSPAMVRAWVKALGEMSEEKLVGPGNSLPQGAGDFAAQARDIQTNKDNQYYKRYWDGDPNVQEMVRNLHRKAANAGR